MFHFGFFSLGIADETLLRLPCGVWVAVVGRIAHDAIEWQQCTAAGSECCSLNDNRTVDEFSIKNAVAKPPNSGSKMAAKCCDGSAF
jgi:hypothetical protein